MARSKPLPPATVDVLPTAIPKIFDQAQGSTANHQKNCVALYKLHTDVAKVEELTSDGKGKKLTGERAFENAFFDMVNRVLPVKKGTAPADRITKFIGAYVKVLNDKAAEDEQTEEDDDTTASRFTARLLKHLIQGFSAKDKSVRYRCVRLVVEMVSGLGEIDEDSYTALRTGLLQRIHDKESFVRVQAVVALSKLCGSETPADMSQNEPTATDLLIEVLAHDPAADVRRAALLNLPLTPATLAPVLLRTRDTDPLLRKLVFSAVLEPQASAEGAPAVGPGHPRRLTIAQRETLVRNGLGDREPAVRAAAGHLLGAWVDVARDPAAQAGEGPEQDVIAFLRMFDLGEAAVAEDALLSVFASRTDVFDALEFDDAYWGDLTPEKAFLGRVFVQHCIAIKDTTRLEGSLPVVTALAFRIQAGYNDLLERGHSEEDEDAREDGEFVIGELLRLACDLDYADEIGRRKMFQLVRDMISQEALPDSVVTRCLDVLRTLSPSERDLIRLVVEVVQELRDPSPAEEVENPEDETETAFGTPRTVRTVKKKPSVEELSPEEQARKDEMDLRCLDLCIGVLERVNGTFEENSTLEGVLSDLIIPSVKRKELIFREKGLISVGLCCLIARRMALQSFQLFIGQVESAPEPLRLRVFQIIFDVLMVHENDFLVRDSSQSQRIVEFLLDRLNKEESDRVQALMVVGLSKLVLSGMVTDERVLKSLVLMFASPDSSDNQELMQCLSYFFPVYSYSSPVNQRRMMQLFIPVLKELVEWLKQEDDEEVLVGPAQLVAMFVDWTDPQKAIDVRGQSADESIHVDMASEILKALLGKDLGKDERKVLCQALPKLFFPETVDDDKIRTLKLLAHNVRQRRPLRDTSANSALAKFEGIIAKRFEKQLEGFDQDEWRKLEELKDLFEFLDDIIPDDDEEEVPIPKKRPAGRKRRSDSIVSDTTASDADSNRTPTPGPSSKRGKAAKGQTKAKRRKVSHGGDSDSEGEEEGTPVPSNAAPTRTLPRRSAATAAKAKAVVEPSGSEEEDEDEEDEDATPAPRARKQAPGKRTSAASARKREEESSEEEDEPADSIMDSDEDME